ncbi:MAG: hypothetical protein IJL14_00960 [Selenomonadaceae bacterium]|nr:hypothetical protein [Selenomonadaceae bacterium]MBR0289071.1 hypothetical protein [Selenomonadaceae bacterium]
MTELEQLSVNVQRQIDAQNARIDSVIAKVDMLVIESQQQREDIRRAQEKHDADIKEMNARIESKFDKLSSQIQSLTIAAVVGVGAIVIGGGAIIWSAISSLK